MRQIVLDTETTGLEVEQGHRIIEIGCVELHNRRKTNNYYHQYLNPQRDVEDGAYEVHGLSSEFLKDKPVFANIAEEFINFIKNSELIIHNAPFDVKFLNAELSRLNSSPRSSRKIEDYCEILDTLVIAREMHPGQKNSIDALCKRYGVDNSNRENHGALLDAGILLDIYLTMTGGQADMLLDDEPAVDITDINEYSSLASNRSRLRVIQPSSEEIEAHHKKLESINKESNGNCLWSNYSD